MIITTKIRNSGAGLPRAAFELDQVAEILEMNPRLRVKFQGHTCDIGTREYNLKLSHRRADAVRQYMIDWIKLPTLISKREVNHDQKCQ